MVMDKNVKEMTVRLSKILDNSCFLSGEKQGGVKKETKDIRKC